MPYVINRQNFDTDGEPLEDGLRIHYETAGSAEDARGALVFAHGFTSDVRLWRAQLEYFAPDYFAVAFDSRGHGLSDAPQSGYSRDHRETDLQAVVDELKLETFHLIGLSMGGATSIGFAIDDPKRLESLTLVSASVAASKPPEKLDVFSQLARDKGVEAAREHWIDLCLRYYSDKPGSARETLHTMMREHSGAPWQDPNRGKYHQRKDLELLGGMEVRTLIMVGANDLKFIPLGVEMNEALPNSRLEIIPAVGHMINLEVPDRFNERLKRWIESGE